MAKIFLIARTRNATLETLISGLETDLQSLQFHSTEHNSLARYVQIFADFLRLQPELVYFVLQNEKLNRLEKALFRTLSALPGIKLAVSFLDQVDLTKSKSLLKLCQKADILTLPTRQALSDLRGFESKTKRQFRALLSPPAPVPNLHESLNHQTEDFLKYLAQGPTWTSFWDLDYFLKYRGFFESVAREKTWVLIGDRSQWTFSQFEHFQVLTKGWKLAPIWFQDLSSVALKQLFQNTELLFMPGLELSPLELSRVSQLAALSGVFTILDTHQIESTSRLWTVGENCELIEKEDVEQVLINQWPVRDFSSLNLRKKPRSAERATDESLNELSRWVSQALSETKRI